MANQDSGFVEITGSVALLVSSMVAESGFISMRASATINVLPKIVVDSGLISISGSATINDTIEVLVNAYATMYGFARISVETFSAISCSDLIIDMSIDKLESFGCIIGESMELKRYRGDTYPVSATLSKNGLKDTTGITFQMSTKIDGEATFTVNGIVTDALSGAVSFPLDVLSVAVAGSGAYDIQGNDGTYIYTYEKGVFTLLDDLTV